MNEAAATIPPHGGGEVKEAGTPLATARAAMILVHGRGGSPEDILDLAAFFAADGLAFSAPPASGGTWYPNSFLAPIPSNEPGISSGMSVLAAVVARIEGGGIPSSRIMLLGFSQGACLSIEFAARNARRYGGVVALSGGLIGPSGTPRAYDGSLDATPVFLGCSDVDPHIPAWRVEESAAVMERLGGTVTKRIYEGMGHNVNKDEIDFVQELVRVVLAS